MAGHIGTWKSRAAFLVGAVLLAAAAAFAMPQSLSALDTMATNGIYDLFVEQDASEDGIGTYTAGTGASHPVTVDQASRQNVLYGGDSGEAWSSYTTIRSYTSSTDYVQTSDTPSSAYTVENLDPYASTSQLGTTGLQTVYSLPGGKTTADSLQITQIWRVNGTTLEDSVVELTTTVQNTGAAGVAIGIRHELDVEMACDDGPTFTPVDAAGDPVGATLTTEETFAAPTFPAYRIEDNECLGSPLFAVFGTAGPSALQPPPTQPELLMYAYWEDAYAVAFDYTTNPANSDPDDDSAMLYFYGATSNTAYQLGPGQSITVTAELFAGEAGEPPPVFQPTPTPTVPNTPESTATEEVVAATATPSIALPETGAGSDESGGAPGWLVAGLAVVGLAAAAGCAAVRLRMRRT